MRCELDELIREVIVASFWWCPQEVWEGQST
jgi:hypothetical protein